MKMLLFSTFLITFLRISSAFINLELPKTAEILGKKVLDSATALTRGMVVSTTELKQGLVSAGETFGIKAAAHISDSVETSVEKLTEVSKDLGNTIEKSWTSTVPLLKV